MFGVLLRWAIIPLVGSAVISRVTTKSNNSPYSPTSNSGSAFNDPPYGAPPSAQSSGINLYQGAKLALMAAAILFTYRAVKEVIK